MSVGKNIGTWFGTYYDKVITFAVLIALAGSLAYLAIRTGLDRATLAGFEDTLARMRPTHPQAALVQETRFSEAVSEVEAPFAFRPGGGRHFLVPEQRVICWDCRKPIAFNAAVCPYCRAEQPVDPTEREDFDGDLDGMPDKWETAHGFNPIVAADAASDADGDGFTNLEEFKAGTLPRDRASSPELIESKMVVSGIKAEPFLLQFKSVTKLPDGTMRFALNTHGNSRTHFAKLGDTVQGFKLAKFEPVEEKVMKGRMEVKVDRSVLTLERGGASIRLIKGEERQYTDFEVELQFLLDGQRFTLKRGGAFELREQRYTVIEIDNDRRVVVLKRDADNKRLTVREAASVMTKDAGQSGLGGAGDVRDDGETPQ